jgi:hypothetical protein
MKINMAKRLLLAVVIALGSSIPAFAANSFNGNDLNIINHIRGLKTSATILSSDSTTVLQYMRLQLFKDAINTDDTYIGFNPTYKTQYSAMEDAPYFQGFGQVSLCSFSSDNMPLAINKLPLPGVQSLTIHLKISAKEDGVYSLNMIDIVAIPQLFEVWLMDAYKKDSLDMRANKTYAFNLTEADTNSYGSKRFSLVIRQNPALGVHLLNFTATKATDGAQTTWTTENEQNYTNFTIERSIDGGVTYNDLSSFASSALGIYSFLDKTPPADRDLYRLKIQDINGTISYSDVITLIYGNGNVSDNIAKNTVNVYPNPAKSTINLSIIDPAFNLNSVATQSIGATANITANTVYSIKIVNNTGSIVKIATTTQQDWSYDVSALLPGTYVVQILNNANKSLIATNKFIKL